MSVVFNADEVFAVAEQIERNGAAFYRKAAENFSDERIKKILLGLAAMEDGHIEIFHNMRNELSDDEKQATTFDPEGQIDEYLKVMAGGYVFKINVDPADLVKPDSTLTNVLDTAIEMEKDSIVFYLGVKEMVPERLGKNKIDALIKEEMRHLALLSREKSAIK